ncbi:MAG TPA: hypothetical protein VHT28_04955 [Silvibacterium sp.]|nr:hypothetical protein [Silvibacterium sp.]
MVVAYGWELIPEGMESRAHSSSVFPLDVGHQLQRYPYEVYRQAAENVQKSAALAASKRQWFEAWQCWQRFASLFDRFRNPEMIAAAREGYLKSAICALNCGSPGLCFRAVNQYFLTGDASPEAIKIKREAKEQAAKKLQQMENLLQEPEPAAFAIGDVVQYAVDYPVPARLALAEQILERFRNYSKDRTKLLLDFANLYMAQGRWHEAVGLLVPEADDARIREPLTEWRNLMERGESRTGVLLGGVPDDCELSLAQVVNHGFSYLVNAFYEDALEWFLFALAKTETDPFALFGHGLCLWQRGMFSLAANRLKRAKDTIENYSAEPRFLGFFRYDDTCASRSYRYDPMYQIFNPGECLAQVTKLQPFVSHVLAP